MFDVLMELGILPNGDNRMKNLGMRINMAGNRVKVFADLNDLHRALSVYIVGLRFPEDGAPGQKHEVAWIQTGETTGHSFSIIDKATRGIRVAAAARGEDVTTIGGHNLSTEDGGSNVSFDGTADVRRHDGARRRRCSTS